MVRLPAPTGLVVTEHPAEGQIDVVWDAVVGATGYERKTSSESVWTDLGNVTSITALAVGYTTGTLFVRAYDANKGRSTSGEWSIEEPGDTTPPTVLSASIDANGTSLFLSFSENVVGHTGFDLDGWSLTYVDGEGTTQLEFSVSSVVLLTDSPNLDYMPGDVEDLAGNGLEAIWNGFIQNNSTQEPSGVFYAGSETDYAGSETIFAGSTTP